MKFIHLADLHIGKRYGEMSLVDDQKYILQRILDIIEAEQPQGVIIAGDVYDKSVPGAEAVSLFDDFLCALSAKKVHTFVISGNHDSAERLAFGGRLMDASGVHISPVYNGEVKPVEMRDEYGKLNVCLLPFVKPVVVRKFFGEEKIESYTDALRVAVEKMNVDTGVRNVLVAHQFVTGSQSAGSEEFSVGDVGNVDGSVFSCFDYVALGHIHGAQNVGEPRLRYCGTPLKYSLSEAKSQKSVTLVELREKGSLEVREIPLTALHDVVEIKGTYAQLMRKDFYENTTYPTDYVHAVLCDEEEIPDAFGMLGCVYKNLVSVRYDNARTRVNADICAAESVESKSPLELFGELYALQNNKEMSDEQRMTMQKFIEKAWGDGE